LGDVDGDGWNDAMVSKWSYPDNITARGIAIIIAGGSYIPIDDPSVHVQAIAVTGVENAIHVWPNPATTELNIAWRGNLPQTPRRFAIYDIVGRLIASGSINDGSSALWRCDGATAGLYRLCIFNARGGQIATISITKL
jgi:hypothetical protein